MAGDRRSSEEEEIKLLQMSIDERLAALEKKVDELEKAVQPEHIARALASELEIAFIEACQAIKTEE